MDSTDFLQQRAREAVADAAMRAGLDFGDARVHRVRSSIHVELPRAQVMARVEMPGSEDQAHRLVQVARFWEGRDTPVARLTDCRKQPYLSAAGAVTLWQWLHAERSVDVTELGRTARTIHDLGRHDLPHDLPQLDPVADVRQWLEEPAHWITERVRLALMRRLRTLDEWWREEAHSDPFGTVLLHGDVHCDNAIVTGRGVVLCDLEDAGVGPVCWDFAPLGAGVRRYGQSRHVLSQFIAGYGEDPHRWAGFEHVCELYELSVVVWALRCAEASPIMAPEAAIRVDGFLGGGSTPWTLM